MCTETDLTACVRVTKIKTENETGCCVQLRPEDWNPKT